MSDIKNIDDLFKTKLGASEVGYSAASWKGASTMLDKHFRLILFKKILMVALPFLFIAGAGSFFYLSKEAPTTSSATSTEVQPSNDLSPKHNNHAVVDVAQVKAKDDVDHNQSDHTAGNVQAHARIETKQDIQVSTLTSSVDMVDKEVPTTVIETNSASVDESVAANTDEANTSTILSSKSETPNKEIKVVAPERTQPTGPMVSTEIAALKLNSRIGFMPIAEFPLIGSEGNTDLLNDAISEPLMKKIRRLQVFAEGGLLVARGFHDLSPKRQTPGFGFHARLLARYELNQSVYLDFGIGLFNRGSLTANGPITGNTPNSTVAITPLSANYASINIGTGYRIGLRHSIGGGFELNPLLAVVARRDKSTTGETKTQTSYASDKAGYYGLDASFYLTHKFSISERLGATSEIHCGIFDVTDNNTFGSGDVNDFNTMLKLGLSYRITRR